MMRFLSLSRQTFGSPGRHPAVIYVISSCRPFAGVFGWQPSRGYFQIILIPLPDFEIKKEDLRMFPKAIVTDAIQALVGSGLPPGYGD
jgi:hypothetical protein